MPKFRILPAGDNTSRPKVAACGRAAASVSASRDTICGPAARGHGFGSAVRSPSRPKSSIRFERRSSVEADVTNRVGKSCWVSLIGKATDCFGELEGSNPFTQLQPFTPLVTQNPCGRFAKGRPLVAGCAYEAGLIQPISEELRDPHPEVCRMQ